MKPSKYIEDLIARVTAMPPPARPRTPEEREADHLVRLAVWRARIANAGKGKRSKAYAAEKRRKAAREGQREYRRRIVEGRIALRGSWRATRGPGKLADRKRRRAIALASRRANR